MTDDRPATDPSWRAQAAKFHTVRPDSPNFALGLAVSHLMTKPAFAKLPFGSRSRVLVGHINRKHLLFVHEGKKVVAFAGWARTSRARAEDWLLDSGDIPSTRAAKAGYPSSMVCWRTVL
jgi:hemolysin-activating ACP:hemolysin acyltransferase